MWNSREAGCGGNGTDLGSVMKPKDHLDEPGQLESLRGTVGETRAREFVAKEKNWQSLEQKQPTAHFCALCTG